MKRALIIIALCAVAAILAVASATGGDSVPAGAPLESGQADFGVDGPDGKPIICKNGKELRVPRGLLMKPPPRSSLPTQAQAGQAHGAMKVWRCGGGANPDKNPQLVPAG